MAALNKNIEELNEVEVETDLVERFDVPLTNKFTPDVYCQLYYPSLTANTNTTKFI